MLRQVGILLVEDDLKDRKFIMRALKQVDPDLDVEIAKDAESALASLNNGSAPKIIVTDLNMPGMGGRGLLETLKTDEKLKNIPAIVLSTSDDESDIAESYRRHANAYMVKPDSIDGYKRIASFLRDFWLQEVKLPNID
ncbi:response regulator [Hirschia litorea]|uniref:Response regulator n=1 Tax=Hirschia litorea TaxID=1199156 RepID=A0ABW2II37_9PROT